jgi:hypothetical protein
MMNKLARLSIELLTAAVVIAAPLVLVGADAFAARPAILELPSTSGAGTPGTDPNVPGNSLFHLQNPRPCVRDSVVLVVPGYKATACDSFIGVHVEAPTHVVYHTWVNDTVACPLVLLRTYPIRLNLGLFPAGPQRIEIEWVTEHVTRSGISTEVRRVPIDFVVSADCVPPGRLPYVDHVQIGGPDCIPPRDSIRVRIEGTFPNGCFQLVKVEVIPDMTMGPLPHSPRIRLTVEDCACCLIVCTPDPVPWGTSVLLPPLPPMDYKLPIELVRTSCNSPVERFAAAFPFTVSQGCGDPPGCLIPTFAPGETSRECNARIVPGQPARLTLLLHSTVAISGLQGELSLGDASLEITRLAPVGATEGWSFRWTPTERGARFTILAKQGEVIPPLVPGEAPPAVLAIGVAVREGHRPPPMTLLVVTQLLASDPEGRDVPWCPTLMNDAFRFAAYAKICAEGAGPCDANGDGHEDIRDLVIMMRCLREGNLCGDSLGRFDCNQDQIFTIDDVICCAERTLGQTCAGCPPGEVRDARDVKLGFGQPVGRIRSIDLPVRIEGAGGIGGARLVFRFPGDRYEVIGVEYGGAAASWLHVSQVGDGRVMVGLIDPAGAGSESQAEVTLRLALKPGREPGGEVTIESAEFAARDGVKLAADVPALRQPLGGMPRLSLSENRPNPFVAATRFAVTLDRGGPVEVAIYDLGGRKLFTLYRGELPAGTREFEWDGRLADGSRARDGVYFYRVASGAETLARKLVLLRSP